MKLALLIWLGAFSTILHAQMVTQVQTKINTDLKILHDVTANADSVPNGKHLIIYKNKTIVKGNMNDGVKNGVWIVYYPNGQQKIKARYIDGKPHGQWIMWSINGDVQAKFQYNHGLPIGHWQGYYYNHSKAIDLVYNPKGKPTQCIQFYDDEIISLNHEYSYGNHTDSIKSSYSYYYLNYNLFHYEQRKNNKLDGLYILYHDNGIIWESFSFLDGNFVRVNESHSKGGMPRKNDPLVNGTGILKRYYSNGNLYSTTTYLKGKKNDSLIIYDFGGNRSGFGFFKNNVAVGVWDVYSKYHTKILSVDFETRKGSTYSITPTSPAPKERVEGWKKNGLRHGEWKSYNASGELLSKHYYKFGFLDGTQYNYQGTKLMHEFHFSYGNYNGLFTYYNTFGSINSKEEFEAVTTIDSNWNTPPEPNWIKIHNLQKSAHQIRIWFYPNLPGTEIIETKLAYGNQKEMMFPVIRTINYKYVPEVIPAQFEGGASVEKEYFKQHLIIPETAKSKRIYGSVLVRYKIDPLGLVNEATILKSIGFGLDEAALTLINSLPPLNPATFNGIPIDSYIVREIDFSIKKTKQTP